MEVQRCLCTLQAELGSHVHGGRKVWYVCLDPDSQEDPSQPPGLTGTPAHWHCCGQWGRGGRWRELPWQRCRARSCGRAAALIPRPLAIREQSSSLEILPSQRQLPPDNDGLATLCLPVLPARASSPRPGLPPPAWELGPQRGSLSSAGRKGGGVPPQSRPVEAPQSSSSRGAGCEWQRLPCLFFQKTLQKKKPA